MQVKEFLKSMTGKISISVIVILSVVIMTQYPTSTKKVFEEYKKTYDISIIEKYYDDKGLFSNLERKRSIEVLEMAMDHLNNNIVAATGGTFEDRNNVNIEKVEINRKSYSSNYVDIDTTIKNNSSKNIRYIKINLYFKDSNNNIVKSEWTNDNATIKPGATQIVSKMMEKGGWSKVSAEIDEIRFE